MAAWNVVLAIVLAPNFATTNPTDDFPPARALLETHCLRCHNEVTRKGGLSLATRTHALEGGESGPAIEPGDPSASVLIDKILGERPEMPKGGNPLPPEDVATLQRWIEAGATWPESVTLAETKPPDTPWWAIQPLESPSLPSINNKAWPRTPIDCFILSRLEKNNLSPRPEADHRTLIRRLTFDLTGLPPTPEQIDTIVADTRPDAYERLVDRLLASPAYGERWARHWLDVVHYADTHGYDKDKRRDHAWPYRDYVIRSLNAGKPYAQFVCEQLAGDVLAPDDPEAVVATGFVAAGPWDFVGHVELGEQTVEKQKTRVIDRDDMVASTMSTFTSLTVHCARCHDHKFDPIPTSEYYRLQAVFAGVDRGDRPAPDPTAAARHIAALANRDAARERLNDIDSEIAARTSPELRELDNRLATLADRIARAASVPPATSNPSPTNGYHSSIHPKRDTLAWVQLDLGQPIHIDEIRLIPARPTDFPDTPGFGFPSVFRIEAADNPALDSPSLIHVESRPDSQRQPDLPLVIRPIDLKARFLRVTATRLWPRGSDFVFALSECEVISDGRNLARAAHVTALDSIEAGRWGTAHLTDGFDSRQGRPALDDLNATHLHHLLATVTALQSERRDLADSLINSSLREARQHAAAELAAAEAVLTATPDTQPVYALLAHDPRPIHVLNRGEVEQPGELVQPGALSLLTNLDPDFASIANASEGQRRSALAHWITDPGNPLTWRTIANRVWLYHFGRGLVDTPNDFGRNGSTPTHPELLDWLAASFRDGDQSLKSLHRLIVTSAVYRQASTHDTGASAIDAENRLLWRQDRRRLEAEEIRDAMLASSGALRSTMYGPGFEVFRFKDDHSPIYDHEDRAASLRPEGHRRAVYRFIVRSVPNPWIECLDGADPNTSVPVRDATLTALQALALLNDAFTIQQAEALAARLDSINTSLTTKIDRAAVLTLGRWPTEEERITLAKYSRTHGLASACRLLFNLNEFLFVD